MATDGGKPIGRRVFLSTLGLGAGAVAAAPALQKTWSGTLGRLSQLDPTGVSGLLPNPGGFRYFSVAGHVDQADPATYRLSIGGLVDRPRELSLADLRAMRQTRVTRDIVCTDGWSVEQVPVDGVRLSDLLDLAGVTAGARAVRFTCFDGVYTESLTLEQTRRADVLVALRMEDRPISHHSGGPVRLYVAPMYFYKSAKWLSGIEVTEKVEPGYWEQTGWPVDAWLPDSSRPVPEVSEQSAYVERFTRAERWVHYATATLFLVCLAAAASLYVAPIAHLVGRRHLVVTIHEWAGVLIALPALLGLASRSFRRDLREINRFTDGDREWLRARSSDPDRGRLAGKFNAGQKLFAAWIAAAVLIMLVTGLLLWNRFSLTWIPRSNILFVHDIGFYLLGVGVAGHLNKAAGEPDARRGMRTGPVRRAWARRTHSRWLGWLPRIHSVAFPSTRCRFDGHHRFRRAVPPLTPFRDRSWAPVSALPPKSLVESSRVQQHHPVLAQPRLAGRHSRAQRRVRHVLVRSYGPRRRQRRR